jgi:hypothetical protein
MQAQNKNIEKLVSISTVTQRLMNESYEYILQCILF